MSHAARCRAQSRSRSGRRAALSGKEATSLARLVRARFSICPARRRRWSTRWRKPASQIAIIMAAPPLTFRNVNIESQSVLYSWHPAPWAVPRFDLLFGDAPPKGRLSATFPRNRSARCPYYNHMSTGRPPSPSTLGIPAGSPLDPKDYKSRYIDMDYTPEYPFGFGLTYTTFEYSNLRLSQPGMTADGSLTVGRHHR